MRTMKKALLLILAVAALACLAPRPAPAQEAAKKLPPSATAVRFAIGDIHGDYKSFVKLLGRLGLVALLGSSAPINTFSTSCRGTC